MLRGNSEESKDIIQYRDDDLSITELNDPILLTPYEDPVLCSDGFIYERIVIMQQMESKNPISPITREEKKLEIFDLPEPVVKKLKRISDECTKKQKEWNDKFKNLEQKLLESRQTFETKLNELSQDKERTTAELCDWREKATTLEQDWLETKKLLEIRSRELAQIKSDLATAPITIRIDSLQTPVADSKAPSAIAKPKTGPIQQSFLNSRLIKAIELRDIYEAGYYLREGAHVDATDSRGDSALILAVRLRFNYPVQAQQLIEMLCSEHYANVNSKGYKGGTALHRAASLNDLWTCQFLLNHAANPLIANDLNETPRQVGEQMNPESFDHQLRKLLIDKEAAFKNKSKPQVSEHNIFRTHNNNSILSVSTVNSQRCTRP